MSGHESFCPRAPCRECEAHRCQRRTGIAQQRCAITEPTCHHEAAESQTQSTCEGLLVSHPTEAPLSKAWIGLLSQSPRGTARSKVTPQGHACNWPDSTESNRPHRRCHDPRLAHLMSRRRHRQESSSSFRSQMSYMSIELAPIPTAHRHQCGSWRKVASTHKCVAMIDHPIYLNAASHHSPPITRRARSELLMLMKIRPDATERFDTYNRGPTSAPVSLSPFALSTSWP